MDWEKVESCSVVRRIEIWNSFLEVLDATSSGPKLRVSWKRYEVKYLDCMQAFQCRDFGIWSIRQTDHSQKKVLRVTEGSNELTTGKLSCGFGLIKMIQDSLGI